MREHIRSLLVAQLLQLRTLGPAALASATGQHGLSRCTPALLNSPEGQRGWHNAADSLAPGNEAADRVDSGPFFFCLDTRG